ncbi:GntR family transcriptional regulator [Oceanobacillus senegalensis]|uniref:GntR family transcriptional regulator n=1 Tax=Oceanobacillus senegalensis TaxID=1936063 RepID=UPI000A30E02F|nr:GntR family transcriptional regulator [Oceanobacillus senegalensis]
MDPFNYMKNAIITGEYKPGKRLTEEALAKELNMSRTPIREAINQLKNDGLVTPLKRGVVVREFTKHDVLQIYDLRALLEGYAASQAASYRSLDDIEKMMVTNQNYREVIRDLNDENRSSKVPSIVQANQAFHKSILEASNNDYISFHLSKAVVIPLVFQSFSWYSISEINRSFEVHETILSAIERQESERAKIAMQEHIYTGRDHVLKHID